MIGNTFALLYFMVYGGLLLVYVTKNILEEKITYAFPPFAQHYG
ncbi:hypothetical protein ADA01nite_02270 [Aneurinibacillus danicus]|jgi:hypothetical protein|uniref:Uncharacterized protein n=1 Tax=Aneurinibacillus danicus TaxID=267746 RepID=A0A511V1I1_9BACL|nr:hypothetical protein ADA01nite_02270 [Aneurinibacillus danicus]